MRPAVFEHPPFPDYSLLDSGNGLKLERYGEVQLERPDPQALWRPRLAPERWAQADLCFERKDDRGGRWRSREGAHPAVREADRAWQISWGAATLFLRPTKFKHVGVFPEQATNWVWTAERTAELDTGTAAPRMLNLFGYSGVASILAAAAGYDVTHVDASRSAINWARRNAEASGLGEGALRLVLEDALTYARRAVRRGLEFEAVLLDPPHYGRGPKSEKWQLEDDLAPLVEACGQLLAERSFLILSSYAVGYSPLAFMNLLEELEGGTVEAGELALPEEGEGARLLPCGFCARWSRGL